MQSEAGEPSVPQPLPLPAPPRVVRRRRERGWLLAHIPLVVWPLVLVGIAGLLLALWLLGSSLAVTLLGSTVAGKVTGTFPAPPGSGADPRVQFNYYVGEQEYSGEEAVDRAAFARLYAGAAVQVRVLRSWPGNPRLVQPAGRSGAGPGCLLFLALLWNGAVGFVLWTFLRKTLAQRGLVRDGTATTGQILGKESVGGRRPWRVQVGYRAPARGPTGDAPVQEREWQVALAVTPEDFEAAEVGALVTVLYDPRQPSRSVIYPFAEYEAVTDQPG